MKHTLTQRLRLGVLLCCAATARATAAPLPPDTITNVVASAGDPLVTMMLDARFDGTATLSARDAGGQRPDTRLGYQGTHVRCTIKGNINPHLSYVFRQRVNRDNGDRGKFAGALDYLNLRYAPTPRFSLTAGKQIVQVGTIEYEYSSIDLYFSSVYFDHADPYQIAVTACYSPAPGQDFHAQVANSPFARHALDNTLAYNLCWQGHIGAHLRTIYSVNMIEYAHGHYINYLALGHQLTCGPATVDLDYMNRHAASHHGFFTDFTAGAKLSLRLGKALTLTAKGGYDQNKAQRPDGDGDDATESAARVADLCVAPGTSRGYYGLAAEYCPVSTRANHLRLHAYWHSSTDKPAAHTVGIGLCWHINAFTLRRP